MDVFGLSSILTVHQNGLESENSGEASLDKKITELVIKKQKNKVKVAQPKQKTKKDDNVIGDVFGEPDDDEVEIPEPTRTPDRRDEGSGVTNTPKEQRQKARRGAELTEIGVRLIEVDAEKGEYKINIKAPRDRAKIEVEFRITGENGSDELVKIKSVDIPNAEELTESSVLINNVKKTEMIRGSVTIDFGTRVRLGGKTYEIK